jgi:hypothetical protein
MTEQEAYMEKKVNMADMELSMADKEVNMDDKEVNMAYIEADKKVSECC